MNKMKVAVISLSAAVVVLLVIVGVVLFNVQRSVQEADYRACMTDRGVYDTSNTSDMVDMAEACHQAVYGN
ncbi:hypothetical protein [Microbacterium sp. NPDC091662]|uniref:hypothetical protein n=1 Tax=Microbacterium sp. NPDC091662 TaxID=3364211 RepID=UPI0037F14BC3